MVQVLHGSATTTARVRAETQALSEPIGALARRLGLDRKTVRKWRGRSSTEDRPMGPKERRSSILTELEEAARVAVRVQTRLPLDDLFAVMREAVPRLTRSALHRALQRHGISRLPQASFRLNDLGLHRRVNRARIVEWRPCGQSPAFVRVRRLIG